MRIGSGLVLALAVLGAATVADAQTWERKLSRGLIAMTLGVLEVQPEFPWHYFGVPPAADDDES
jgi:hypothetical protein